jgi:hypothetical protein
MGGRSPVSPSPTGEHPPVGSFRQLLQRTNGDVELRVTDDPLTFGATMIDGELDSRHTRIVIQHYSYKKREAREPNPVFALYPRDAECSLSFGRRSRTSGATEELSSS